MKKGENSRDQTHPIAVARMIRKGESNRVQVGSEREKKEMITFNKSSNESNCSLKKR